jgi:uncharacterized protein involved in exopolysaccharide biosynthesis
LKEFFLESKTSKVRTMLDNQERIVDSLRYLLNSNESALARVKDQNEQIDVFNQGKVSETRLTRKTQMLTQSYQQQDQILQNLKFQLYQDSPLFKITSPQRLPIFPEKPSLTKTYKIGIIIGLFLSLIYIVISDAIKTILKEEKK